MKTFDHIAIIFNPGSKGEAPTLAKNFSKRLKEQGFASSLTPTDYAGHAIELAKAISLKYKRPLLISVSGDGGYNEIITGAMQAKRESKDATPVTAVIAAGNANDHKRVTRGDTSLLTLIKKHAVKPLDILEAEATAKDFTLLSYAHSYIGLGLTPVAGDTLNQEGKSLVKEVRALIKTFSTFIPFPATIDGVTRNYDNIIFGNINEMAKIVKLHEKVTLTDGRFEVIRFRHYGLMRMLFKLIRTALFGVQKSYTTSEFTLSLPEKQLMQLDGEVVELPADTTLTVRSVQGGMESLY